MLNENCKILVHIICMCVLHVWMCVYYVLYLYNCILRLITLHQKSKPTQKKKTHDRITECIYLPTKYMLLINTINDIQFHFKNKVMLLLNAAE